MSNADTIKHVKSRWTEILGRYLAVAAIVAGFVLLFRKAIQVNPTTVALTLLLSVLLVSAYWGLRYALALAVFASISFNYFFLPPLGTFTISDPQNWVALLAFLVTAILASQLSERARRETASSNQRRRDVERLYALSQRLLVTDSAPELLNAIPGYLFQIFSAKSAIIYLSGNQEVYRSDARSDLPGKDELQAATARGEPITDNARDLSIVPLRLGTRITGALGMAGVRLSRETADAIGSLVAISIERVGAIEKLGKAEAARQSENLRAALLDSVTHELRTPLTGIKAAVTSLLSPYQLGESQRTELLTIINEEADRLDRLVSEATEMAQLDAQQVELHLQLAPMRNAIQTAVEQSKLALAQHPTEIRVAPELPLVRMDVERIVEVLKHLLENAAKYSPLEGPITIMAELINKRVTVSVADRGAGIDDFEQSLVFEKFYRGRDQRYSVQGTGMGLAIVKAIVEAHGGAVGVTSQVGHGSVFYFWLAV
jgi:two-component system, OmpR family, sensor histidine kinase KdpD